MSSNYNCLPPNYVKLITYHSYYPCNIVHLVAETKGVSMCGSILTVYKRNIGLLAVLRAFVTYIVIAVQVLNGERLSPVAVWGGDRMTL
ncbi:hypothetical protein I312_101079 [Cryptococcus bacillisporus CA1280]|uniref:uncharacterized protein n=1 Tax=Cryptococcus bacillisporus CA1280 TaxID=1296109 RepID=UPI003368E640